MISSCILNSSFSEDLFIINIRFSFSLNSLLGADLILVETLLPEYEVPFHLLSTLEHS